MPAVNPLPFQYLIRGFSLHRLDGTAQAEALEQRDAELEDYLGRLDVYVRSLEDRIAVLEGP